MRTMRTPLAVVLGGALLAACSAPGSGSSTPTSGGSARTDSAEVAPMAQQLCAEALGAQVVSSGPLTTVGELRGMKQGPGFQPAKDAFPELPAATLASFCWTGGNGQYDSFGVTVDGQKVSLGGMRGVTSVPSGPPVIP